MAHIGGPRQVVLRRGGRVIRWGRAALPSPAKTTREHKRDKETKHANHDNLQPSIDGLIWLSWRRATLCSPNTQDEKTITQYQINTSNFIGYFVNLRDSHFLHTGT